MGNDADSGPARSAAILAGGAGSRMGVPKAGVRLAGRPLASYPVEAARQAGLEPFLVAKRASDLPELGVPVVREPAEPRHPLAGIIAALEHVAAPVVVVACDLPLVPAGTLAELAAAPQELVVASSARPQPLLARYTPGLLPRLREALAAGEAMTDVVDSLGARPIEVSEDLLTNVNRAADLAAVEAQLSGTTSTRAL